MGYKHRTILLIDDETDLVDVVAFQLKAKRGYDVVTASNGVEALEKLAGLAPDLIILDMNMPKMGGIEFYRKISGADGKTLFPVLILTARANLEELFKDLNADGFMTKPFELDDLFKEIDMIISKRYENKLDAIPVVKNKPNKVLIVDDNREAFDKIGIAFLNAGYSVSCARSGAETVEKIIADMPDLIVIKLGLPDLAGHLVITKLRQMPRTMNVACVLYTRESERLNHVVTDKLCAEIGIRKLVESDDPAVLLPEAELALGKK